MSRMKLLLDVVSDLRSLADSIQAVCDAMASGGPMDIEKPKEEQQKTAQKVKAEKAPTARVMLYRVLCSAGTAEIFTGESNGITAGANQPSGDV